MSTNANAARQVLETIITSAGRDALTLVALVVVMIIQSPVMTLVVVIIGPVATFTTNRLVRRVRRAAKEEYRSLGRVVAGVQETALGIRIVKAFNLEPFMRRRMDESIKGYASAPTRSPAAAPARARSWTSSAERRSPPSSFSAATRSSISASSPAPSWPCSPRRSWLPIRPGAWPAPGSASRRDWSACG
jgi:ABC-type multidrug transport system fused ATPase/permease subunit